MCSGLSVKGMLDSFLACWFPSALPELLPFVLFIPLSQLDDKTHSKHDGEAVFYNKQNCKGKQSYRRGILRGELVGVGRPLNP